MHEKRKGIEMIKEFKEFLLKQNAIALAIGVIIGAGIGKVVAAIADDVLNPIIGLLLPAGDWRNAKIVLSRATDAGGKVTENAIAYGDLIGRMVDFIIIAFVVYMITKAFLPKPGQPTTKECPECREVIPKDARRCKACAQPQPA
ncbi:MAG TPA: large conductance mechanosensitive channel protein MscL [Thermoanaerobaculia bacterium]|nr:large conductance mechanosensitive channel protein MscL [Thermoanaerobaculia bacterium]